VNEGGSVAGAGGNGATFFNDNCNAGNGTFINVANSQGGIGYIYFNGNSSAANGTFINGNQVTEAVLKPGQILRLGTIEMRLIEKEFTIPAPPQENGAKIASDIAPS